MNKEIKKQIIPNKLLKTKKFAVFLPQRLTAVYLKQKVKSGTLILFGF